MLDDIPGRPEIIRTLTPLEELSWSFNAIDCFNAAIAAHVEGRTTLEGWRSALNAVQRRHPSLSVGIGMPAGYGVGEAQPFLQRLSAAPIPLRVVRLDDVRRWETEVERELAHPFESGDCPLIRASLIHGEDEAILILAATHAVTDGMSLSFLVRDVLTALSRRDLAQLPFPPSADDLLGFDAVVHGPVTSERRGGGSTGRPAGPPEVSTVRIEGSVTRAVGVACHRNGCTVHGALVAAVVTAMRRCAPDYAAKPLRSISPISIRDLAGAGEANAMYIVLRGMVFDPGAETAFWDLARRVQRDIAEASSRDAVQGSMAAVRGLVADGITVEEAAAALDGAFALDVLVTNLGRVAYPSNFGSLTLRALFPAVLNTQPASQAVAVATVGDTLCLLNTSRKPVAGLLESVRSTLTERGANR